MKYNKIKLFVKSGDMIKLDYTMWQNQPDVVSKLKSYEENLWLIIQSVNNKCVSFKNQKDNSVYDVCESILEFKKLI